MTHLIYDPLVQALGSTVLHSFWQATLLAIVLWLISRRSGFSATRRYWLGMGALAAQLLISLATLKSEYIRVRGSVEIFLGDPGDFGVTFNRDQLTAGLDALGQAKGGIAGESTYLQDSFWP